MSKSSILFVGMDVHKETIDVAIAHLVKIPKRLLPSSSIPREYTRAAAQVTVSVVE